LACAHDAGGANLLIHTFRSKSNVDFILTGPAAAIALSLGVPFTQSLPSSGISIYDTVYAGSNSQSQLSDEIFSLANNLGIKTVGVLDHWVNYRLRWKFKPKRVEVQDFRALVGGFFYFGLRIRLKENLYLKSIRSHVLERTTVASDLLVVLQPINGIFRHSLEDPGSCFCPSVLKRIRVDPSLSAVILREHSNTYSEDCRNYLELKTELKVISTNLATSLSADIQRCSTVIGLDSYALYICKKLSKKVLTTSSSRRSWFAPKYQILQ
jgi:hypothetical protein